VAGGFQPFENWLLELDGDVTRQRRNAFALITNHEFTDAVFAYRDEEGDDFRRIVDHRLSPGTQSKRIPSFESTSTGTTMRPRAATVPHQIVVQQLVHLETLSRAGLLRGIETPIEPRDSSMTTDQIPDTSNIASIREHRLEEEFLDRPPFSADENDRAATRRAAALAGWRTGWPD